jgi:hypothetical protein
MFYKSKNFGDALKELYAAVSNDTEMTGNASNDQSDVIKKS